MRQHSSILDVSSFRGVDCDTDHNLVVTEVRMSPAVVERAVKKMDVERFSLKKLNGGGGIKEQYQVTVINKFAAIMGT